MMWEPGDGLKKFRAEWHSYQGASSIIEAHSRKEAEEIEKGNPFSGSDFDLFLGLENFFAFECEQDVRYLYKFQLEDKKSGIEQKPDQPEQDGEPRHYHVSAEYRQICVKDVFAPSLEAADRALKNTDNQKDPNFFLGWKLVKKYECIVAEPVPKAE